MYHLRLERRGGLFPTFVEVGSYASKDAATAAAKTIWAEREGLVVGIDAAIVTDENGVEERFPVEVDDA